MACYLISGNIAKDDLAALQTLVSDPSRKRAKAHLFYLNSPGGDPEAAIEIGRLLRRVSALAVVPLEGSCYSSCVFVLAGATYRSTLGKVGIHRPYLASTSENSFSTVQQQQRSLESKAKQYLSDMNVLPALYDAMIVVPPENIRILSDREQDNFGLGQVDQTQQELDDSQEARQYGLSKPEYLRRKALIDRRCGRDGALSDVTTAKWHEEFKACREATLRAP